MEHSKIVLISQKGTRFILNLGENIIGRSDPETGSVAIDLSKDDVEDKVSRQHALIQVNGSNVSLEDLGSLNGTFLKSGHKLSPTERCRLKNGEEFLIGKTLLKLEITQ
jgi:pSer/pThr/pTyr-binding forkhead associated (FHA) protein